MTEYDKTNTFVLFVNDKKGNDKAPDRSGTLNVDGVEFYIDGWLKQGKNGAFLSGRIKAKRAAPGPRGLAHEDNGTKAQRDADEDIPF
jgi:hypothetical protein